MKTDEELTLCGGSVADALSAGIVIGRRDPIQPAVQPDERSYPVVLVPEGFKVESLRPFIERDVPDRRRANVSLFDAASFGAYVNAFKSKETRIFADVKTSTIVAIFDYHQEGESGAARWAQNRASLTLRKTPEWERWVGMHGQRVAQLAFAEFIEDQLPDIADPDGTTILQVSRSLHATKTTNFVSDVRLDNGQTQLTFHETIAGSAQVNAQKVDIPSEFTLGIAPYEGADKYQVRARLRYRVGDGARLTIGVDLVRHDVVLRDAFLETLNKITSETSLPILRGAAPAEFK